MKREKHDSIMRPPAGKKHMPWRTADAWTRYDSMHAAWTWHEGYAVLSSDPTWLLIQTGITEWSCLHGGVVQASHLTRQQASAWPASH